MSQPPVNQRPPGPPVVAGRAGPSHSPRSGAHRPRRPLWHDVLPAVVVLVAVVALVLGFFQLKDSVLGSSSTGSTSSVDTGAEDPGQGTAPTAPVTTSPTTKPSATPTSGATRTATTPAVNHKARVTVLNSTSRTGLAKGAASRLSAAGWRASSGGNQSFSGSTTVFYTQDRLRATAQAIAKDLGGYPVRKSTAYGSIGVIVILGNDYSR